MSDTDNKPPIDYAIIGGGVSGAYSVWRLKQALPEARVALFEYSDRIGGKLFSRTLPGMPNVVAELGGMRYIPKAQPLVTGLIEELDLPSKVFPMGSPKTGDDNNYCYFRQTHLLNKQMSDPDIVPYNLDWAEQGKSPNELMNYVAKMLVPDLDDLEFEDWFEVRVFGKYLWEWGFWNLLYRVLSPEAYAYMQQGLGYDTNVANGNAINLLITAGDTSGSDAYRTLVDGYEALPIALAKQFQEKFHGEEYRNLRLAQLTRGSDDLYDLLFVATKTDDYRTIDEEPGKTVRHRAKHVILAMPRRSIELIDWPLATGNAWLKDNLASVLIQPAFKLFLGYPYPWWHGLGLQAGRSITDLPIRQAFYFGTQGEQPGADPKNLSSLLMASYNDLGTVPFWKGLERGEPFRGEPGYEHCDEGEEVVPASEFHASGPMVREAHRQVEQLHGQRELPKPYSAIYHDWGDDPYGGGWHSWKAGYRYDKIVKRMTHPVPGENVYVCGAAYSLDQGWVEGALETAEQMLEDDLGVPKHPCLETWSLDPLKRLKARLQSMA